MPKAQEQRLYLSGLSQQGIGGLRHHMHRKPVLDFVRKMLHRQLDRVWCGLTQTTNAGV